MKELHLIVDLQFGSTGKGLLAGLLAKQLCPDTLIVSWGPNAGHTFIDYDDEVYINIAVPNGIVAQRHLKRLMFGPGSIINPEIMWEELERYHHLCAHLDIMIHEHAAVVTQEHRDMEAAYAFGIGSTMKGVGEAQIQKMRRKVGGNNAAKTALVDTPLAEFVVTREEWNAAIDAASVAIIEGAQGFSLSLNQGFYPYVTSRDCTVNQQLSDCGIPHSRRMNIVVHGTTRTYPIRVANRFKDGVQVGTSGPCYADQEEIEWSELGLEPELTTVTKLPRRVFTFSVEQVRQAIRMNGVDDVFLNFANYNQWRNGRSVEQTVAAIGAAGARVRWVGYGPRITDVVTL